MYILYMNYRKSARARTLERRYARLDKQMQVDVSDMSAEIEDQEYTDMINRSNRDSYNQQVESLTLSTHWRFLDVCSFGRLSELDILLLSPFLKVETIQEGLKQVLSIRSWNPSHRFMAARLRSILIGIDLGIFRLCSL